MAVRHRMRSGGSTAAATFAQDLVVQQTYGLSFRCPLKLARILRAVGAADGAAGGLVPLGGPLAGSLGECARRARWLSRAPLGSQRYRPQGRHRG